MTHEARIGETSGVEIENAFNTIGTLGLLVLRTLNPAEKSSQSDIASAAEEILSKIDDQTGFELLYDKAPWWRYTKTEEEIGKPYIDRDLIERTLIQMKKCKLLEETAGRSIFMVPTPARRAPTVFSLIPKGLEAQLQF